jgi:hypothetical protein
MLTSGQSFWKAVLIGLSTTALSACASYYMVRDPHSGSTYYTKDVKNEGDAGAVRFEDERSGSVVTLPTSEVKEISAERYREGIHGQ